MLPMKIEEKRYRMKVIFERIEQTFSQHLTVLDQVFRHLQSKSDAYPQLSWKCIAEFIRQVDFIDEKYSIFQLKLDFIETFSSDKKVNRTAITTNVSKLSFQGARLALNVQKWKKKPNFIKIVNNFKTKAMKDEEKKQADNKTHDEPKNLFSRLHFYEFILRISL